MRLARAGSADQDDVALLGDELAAGKIALPILVDRRAFEREVVDILGERQLGDGELISDRTRVLLRYLRLEQIADEPLRLMLALERSGVNLVVGALHAVELGFTHHFDDFGSLHGQALLSWSYRAQSATGACWSFSASGVKIGATGPDRGREGFCTSPPSEPYGRFSRIRLSSRWFPHRDCLAFRQAASRVNSSGGAKNLFGRQTIPNTSFDTVTGADSMRSVQTEPFTRDKSRASAPCLAICINGAVMASSRFPTSIFLPCLPSRGVC